MHNLIEQFDNDSAFVGDDCAGHAMPDTQTLSGSEPGILRHRAGEEKTGATDSSDAASVRAVSIVIPAYNEAENLPALIAETDQAMSAMGIDFEIVVVDDASVDDTVAVLERLTERYPRLISVQTPRNQGQSAAICRGVLAARSDWIGTLDGDGQNVPGDFVRLIQSLKNVSRPDAVGMLAGHRVKRDDTWVKRVSSRVANAVRARILGDGIADTGCGIKLFRRSLFLKFPCFDHMHRFLPALTRMHGMQVVSVPVQHRARQHGESKYGLLDRLLCGIPDLLGVAWLKRRALADLDPGPGDPES